MTYFAFDGVIVTVSCLLGISLPFFFKFLNYFKVYVFIYFIYLFVERAQVREGQREGETESQKGSVPSAHSPVRGCNSLTVRS